MDDLYFYGLSKHGKKTSHNEDYFVLPDTNENSLIHNDLINEKGYLFVVCDGLGGANKGEFASQRTAEMIVQEYYESNFSGKDLDEKMIDIIEKVNTKVFNISLSDSEFANMGTTAASMLIYNNTAYMHNVGDSRIYLFINEEKLEQVTEDDSEVWMLYKQGLIKKDDIINNARKHILTAAMAAQPVVNVHSYIFELPKKFMFLLCSDGLTDVVKDSDLKEILISSDNLKDCAEKLYKKADENGTRDDVTIVLVSNYMQKDKLNNKEVSESNFLV